VDASYDMNSPPDASLIAIDRLALQRDFARAAAQYETHAVLQARVERELCDRVVDAKFTASMILDIGAGTGRGAAALQKHFAKAHVIALDFALPMLQQARRHLGWIKRFSRICADADVLPLADASVDLIFSSLCVQWSMNLPATLREWARVLKPGGRIFFATFGSSTLHELRSAWASVDQAPHVMPFLDIIDVGNALPGQLFTQQVVESTPLTLTYDKAIAVMRDLKNIGAQNVVHERRRGLTGARTLQQVVDAYEPFRSEDGRVPATFEVLYASAIRGPNSIAADGGNVARISANSIKRLPARN
jgi:malonyl-CoA O-methyltransferase